MNWENKVNWERKLRESFKIMILSKPHEVMHDRCAQYTFPHLIELKTVGYRKEHGENVLPFDTSDFIANHIILCEKITDDHLRPVMGFKSVTLAECDRHRIPFPMIGMLQGREKYVEVIQNKLDEYRKKNQSHLIAYNGSFTISPNLRKDKELMKHLWDLTFSLIANFYLESGIHHVLAVSSTKFNVHIKKIKEGWSYIYHEKKPLEEYPSYNLFHTPLVPMELTELQKKVFPSQTLFHDMWVERKIISRKTTEIYQDDEVA